jgi:quercetin dioxygenase-like cupin family protein
VHKLKATPAILVGKALLLYLTPGKEGIYKHVLVGPAEGAPHYIIRYFRLEPGCSSNYESHEKDHGVVILHGKGKVQLNESFFELEPYDAVYVSSNDIHQFTNTGDEPFGFLCVIIP